MPFMRNSQTNAYVGPMGADSAEYRFLQALRVGGQANNPIWEDMGVEDAEAAGALIDGKVAVTIQVLTGALGAAVNSTVVVGRAPFAGTVAKAEYYPAAAIAGAATNNRTFNIIEGGAAGAGATVVATLNMAAGVNAVAQASLALPLSVVANATVVASGDELEFQSLAVGTGIADPGGLVVVTFTRE